MADTNGENVRQKWLDSLKVGDEVYHRVNYRDKIEKIAKITPKRSFVLESGIRFDKSGVSESIFPMFEADTRKKEMVKRAEFIRIIFDHVQNGSLAKMSNYQLELICEIMQKISDNPSVLTNVIIKPRPEIGISIDNNR